MEQSRASTNPRRKAPGTGAGVDSGRREVEPRRELDQARRVGAGLAELAGAVPPSSRGAAWHGRQDVYLCQEARD